MPRSTPGESSRSSAPGQPSVRLALPVWLVAVGLLIASLVCLSPVPVFADEEAGEQPDAAEAKDDDRAEQDAEAGVSLPTDRLRERQLDRARRLVADARWSDAATLLDEILAADRDFFFRPDLRKNTWRSIKAEASRLVGELPPPGREAYALQFRARADRLLAQAIAQNDADGVIAVARRWSHTPAGRQATVLAALEALDANQPLAAAAWLDRLHAAGAREFEPTVSIMRAKAWWLAGQREKAVAILEQARATGATVARLGGKDISLSFPSGGTTGEAAAFLASIAGGVAAGGRADEDWLMHRGDTARNGISTATRPLLVPRYRVPLTRHPEEARLLEKRRKSFADRNSPLLPAGRPLAVGEALVLHTPMGLLAVDFASGKRVWLQTGGSAALWADGRGTAEEGGEEDGSADETGSAQSVFADSTSGLLSSNGQFVFAVESSPFDVARAQAANGMRRIIAGPARPAGNRLSAYDVADKGGLRWRLPAEAARGEGGADNDRWYMGAPLVLGDQLFVLVEERGEIRLDALAAADGTALWSQPLAELDEDQAADTGRAQERRLSGLSPSFAEGVLVCPTGSGALVALDLATRTLLWASNYSVPAEQGAQVMRFGVRVQIGGLNGRGLVVNGQFGNAGASGGGWRDAAPILSGGRVILAAVESDKLQCLDLRSGGLVWEVPREQGLYVAGVVGGRVIVVGSQRVDALALADGKRAWARSADLGGAGPSGFGIITTGRLFLPTDAAEVVEIALEDGRIVGRSPARGGGVPGNLLAHRGEVVSQGVDSLDVFHQAAPLEERIETALQHQPEDPWALLWRGQLDLDRGDVTTGLQRIRQAQAARPDRIPAEVVGDALLFAMRRDFTAAAAVWREAVAADAALSNTREMICLAADRFLEAGDFPAAWQVCQRFLDASADRSISAAAADALPRRGLGPGLGMEAGELIQDPGDPALQVSASHWFRGRLETIRGRGPADLQEQIDAFVSARARPLLEAAPPDLPALGRFVAAFGSQPAAAGVQEAFVAALDRAATADESGLAAGLRRDLVQLGLSATARDGNDGPAPAAAATGGALGDAWPIGRVATHRGARPRREDAQRASRVVSIPVDSTAAAVRLGYELHSQMLVATDALGRTIGEPFPFDGAARLRGMGANFQAVGAEAFNVGRLLVVRSGATVAAFALPATPADGTASAPPRRLWTASDGTDDPAAEFRGVGMGFALGRGAGGRLKRSGNVPLGMKVSEPDDAQLPLRGTRVTAAGVAMLDGRAVELRDPVSGDLLWQRRRLPVSGELLGDDEFLCVVPRDGKGAVVLSMLDGRIVRRCDLPRHEQRLMASGRRIVVIEPVAAGNAVFRGGLPEVRLDLLDPVTLERVPLGSFAGNARATPAGAGALAVVEPSGTLTLLDVSGTPGRGTTLFRVALDDMPKEMQSLQVLPWEDRLIVVVGRQETAEEQQRLGRLGAVSGLPLMTPGDEPAQPITGSVWAVARESGEMLWPVPATIERHAVARGQPSALPLLLFARLIQPAREGDHQRLGVLCLDKRTGCAVHLDDKIVMQHPLAPACDMIGDPARHEITLLAGEAGLNRVMGGGQRGGDPAALRIVFTGEPAPPRPPYQASTKPPVTGDLTTELKYWLRKALTVPLPF